MTKSLMRSAFAFALLVAGGSVLRADNPQTMAAVVIDFQGPPSAFVVKRGATATTPKIFMELLDRDQIVVLDRGGRMRVNFTNGTLDEIDASKSPYLVTVRGAPRSTLDKIFAFLEDAITRQRDLDIVGTSSRGGGNPRLVTRGLADRTAAVCAGYRRIGVAWVGGTAPFQVEIKDPLGNFVLRPGPVNAFEVITLESRVMTQGNYAIVLRDADGRLNHGGFVVVPERDCVKVDEAGAPAWIEPAPRVTLAAGWLSSGDRRDRWSYEAYLRLIEVERNYAPARTLMDVIAVNGSADATRSDTR